VAWVGVGWDYWSGFQPSDGVGRWAMGLRPMLV
jgi:hypothetical protein